GCLGGGSAPTRFYVLAPVDGVTVAGDRPLAVGIGPVSLAGYLDRPQIVTRPAADKIDLGEFDQWGEPLRDGITRVLAEDLSRQLPGAKISTFPGAGLGAGGSPVWGRRARFGGPGGGRPPPGGGVGCARPPQRQGAARKAPPPLRVSGRRRLRSDRVGHESRSGRSQPRYCP